MAGPTFYDLFAGIGGFHAAMRVFGGRCVMAAEIDEAARETYLSNFTIDGPFYHDIRELTEEPGQLAALPRADVLCAGFPCQPFSKSGHQMGLRDRTRGTLFFDIMTVVQATKPEFLILENVRNLAGPRHRDTWRTIVESIRDEGYQVADDPIIASPHVIPHVRSGLAAPGGRPQVRERVFVLARRVGSDAAPQERVLDPQALDLDLDHSVSRGRGVWRLVPPGDFDPATDWDIVPYLDETTDELLVDYGVSQDEHAWLDAWQDFVNNVDWPRRALADGTQGSELTGFPVWNDEMRPRTDVEADIDATTPDWRALIMRRNAALYEENRAFIDSWRERHRVEDFPASRQKFEWQAQGLRDFRELVLQFRPSGLRVKRATYLPALVAINQTSIIGRFRRQLTPVEAARLQGFDAPGFRIHQDPREAYKQLGNAVNVGVVSKVARALFAYAETRYSSYSYPDAA